MKHVTNDTPMPTFHMRVFSCNHLQHQFLLIWMPFPFKQTYFQFWSTDTDHWQTVVASDPERGEPRKDQMHTPNGFHSIFSTLLKHHKWMVDGGGSFGKAYRQGPNRVHNWLESAGRHRWCAFVRFHTDLCCHAWTTFQICHHGIPQWALGWWIVKEEFELKAASAWNASYISISHTQWFYPNNIHYHVWVRVSHHYKLRC